MTTQSRKEKCDVDPEEVLRRMLNTPPEPHKKKKAKRKQKKKPAK